MANTTKVLMVDDDKMLLDMYSERLELAGFDVQTSSNGEECLAKMHQIKPDIVLLDIMMPKVNGYETLASIKSDPETKDIPVIILSALVRDINKGRAIEAGADDYIIKSEVMPSDVISKINGVLQKYHKDIVVDQSKNQPSVLPPSVAPKPTVPPNPPEPKPVPPPAPKPIIEPKPSPPPSKPIAPPPLTPPVEPKPIASILEPKPSSPSPSLAPKPTPEPKPKPIAPIPPEPKPAPPPAPSKIEANIGIGTSTMEVLPQENEIQFQPAVSPTESQAAIENRQAPIVTTMTPIRPKPGYLRKIIVAVLVIVIFIVLLIILSDVFFYSRLSS